MENQTPMLLHLVGADRGQTRWMDRAECRNWDPEIFYPLPPEGNRPLDKARYADDVAEAIEICAVCPVRDLCLKDANDRGETNGVWGGQDFYKSRRQQAAESRMAS